MFFPGDTPEVIAFTVTDGFCAHPAKTNIGKQANNFKFMIGSLYIVFKKSIMLYSQCKPSMASVINLVEFHLAPQRFQPLITSRTLHFLLHRESLSLLPC